MWWPGGAPKHRGFPRLGFNPKNRIKGSGFYATDPEGSGFTPAAEGKPEEQKSPPEKKESSPEE